MVPGAFWCFITAAKTKVETKGILSAPEASRVELSGQFMDGNRPMVRNSEGVWSTTVRIPDADIYPYNFIVDGVSVQDQNNTEIFPNENFKASLLEIPDPDALYTVNDVPHGKVQYCTYHSEVLDSDRPLLVYTDRKSVV